jgi:hypothetical protein
VCSVLNHEPCPTYFVPCSVFDRQPCTPGTEAPFPFGQTLQLTIPTRNPRPSSATAVDGHDEAPEKLDTISRTFAACAPAGWRPIPMRRAPARK